MLTILKYIALVGTFFIYTTSRVFSKLASQRKFFSLEYIAFLACFSIHFDAFLCVFQSFGEKGLNSTPLKEHRKVYRQIQDRTLLHHLRAIGHPGKDADVIEIQFQEILG